MRGCLELGAFRYFGASSGGNICPGFRKETPKETPKLFMILVIGGLPTKDTPSFWKPLCFGIRC